METKLIEQYGGSEGIIVCGDCRMDSPGFSAVKGTYSLMDHDTGVLLSMEHGDCYVTKQAGRLCGQVVRLASVIQNYHLQWTQIKGTLNQYTKQ